MTTATKHVPVTKAPAVEKATPARARMLTPLEEMEHLFDRVLGRGWLRPMRWEFPTWGEFGAAFEGMTPKVDVIDRETEIVVRAQVPGVERKDLEITLADNLLTLKGRTTHETKEEKGDFHRREMTYGEFTRTIALPAEVDDTKARATLKDGVLEMVMPKVAAARRRAIKIE